MPMPSGYSHLRPNTQRTGNAKRKGAGSIGQYCAGCVPGPPAPGTKLLPRWTYVVFPPGEATGKTLRCCALVMGDPSSAAPTCQPKPHSAHVPRPCQRLGRSRAAALRVGCLHDTQGRASKSFWTAPQVQRAAAGKN